VGKMVTKYTGLESRVTILGHLQRGGSPTAFDRLLATRYGTKAAELANTDEYGKMVALQGAKIVAIPIEDAIRKQRVVDPNSEIIKSAQLIGTSFGVANFHNID